MSLISFQHIPKRWQVETLRVCLYILALVVLCFFYFWQNPFISFSLLGPSFLVISLGLGIHFALFFKLDSLKEDSGWLLTTFIADSFLISLYVYFSSGSVSLFLMLHLVNIILGSFLFKGQGALVLALVTSLNFSWVQILGPEFKTLSHIMTLAVNNLAFFGVAGLSGYLSERLFETESKLKTTESNLRTLEDLYSVIVDKSPLALLTVDSQGHIVQMNTKAVMLFPLIKSTDVFTHFFSPLKDIWPRITNLESGEEYRKELSFENGEENAVYRLIATPVAKSQDLYLLLIEDLTDTRKMEFHLKQSEKLAAIGGLAAGVAHEIRNPLAGISGSIELLSQTTHGEDDRKLMKIILREIDRLNNLISEFLDYAKPSKPPEDKVNLPNVIADVLSQINSSPNIRKDAVVITHLPDNCFIKGDANKLKQAFLNLILNAFQAMEKSEKAELQVSIKKDSSFWQLKIKDTGSGMSEGTLKRLFEPFYTTKAKGTGLGLAVTHKIIESHGANIHVRSQLGSGSEFEFNFPCFSES